MANKPGTANFFPDVPAYPEMGTFQPVYGKFDLTTYIQGASDYEIMAFLVGKYNACLEAYDKVTKLSTDTITAAHQLQDWINTWFDNLDVQQELNNKIDSMVADGSFGTLLHQTFDTQINQQTTNAVTAWLVANVTPTGSAVVVDKSLSIEGAAADAKATGNGIKLNKDNFTATNSAINTVDLILSCSKYAPLDNTASIESSSSFKGYYLKDEIDNVLKGTYITGVMLYAATSGTFSLVVLNTDTLEVEKIGTINLTEQSYAYYYITPRFLNANEKIGFGYYGDTGTLIYSKTLNTYPFKELNNNTFTEYNNYSFYCDIFYRKKISTTKASFNQTLNLTNSGYNAISIIQPGLSWETFFKGWYYNDAIMNKLRNCILTGVTIYVHDAGRLSIVLNKNNSIAPEDFTIIKTYNVQTGFQHLLFPYPIKLSNNEYIGIGCYRDTANIGYSNTTTQTFYELSDDIHELNVSMWSIWDIAQEYKYGQYKISVLGDSISTFKDYSISGNPEYPVNSQNWNSPITDLSEMWYSKVARALNSNIDTVNAYGGSRFTTGGNYTTFESRCNNLGNPDIIIVFGGINEILHTQNNSLGEYNFGQEHDKSTVRGAIESLIETIRSNYPNAKLFFMTPVQSNQSIFTKASNGISYYDLVDSIKTICNAYNVDYIDTANCGITTENNNNTLGDGVHPNGVGMSLIAEYVISKMNKA